MKKSLKGGFTLVELMIVTVILTFAISGIIQLYIYTSVAAQLAGSKSLAVSEAQSKIEEIRNHEFDNIYNDYVFGGSENPFTLAQLNGVGVINIAHIYTDELFSIEVGISWEDKYGRIVGEDLNLDGVLDSGEDANLNGDLDHGISIMGMITKR